MPTLLPLSHSLDTRGSTIRLPLFPAICTQDRSRRPSPGRAVRACRMACERLEVALQRVGSVVRFRFPFWSRAITSRALAASRYVSPATTTP